MSSVHLRIPPSGKPQVSREGEGDCERERESVRERLLLALIAKQQRSFRNAMCPATVFRKRHSRHEAVGSQSCLPLSLMCSVAFRNLRRPLGFRGLPRIRGHGRPGRHGAGPLSPAGAPP